MKYFYYLSLFLIFGIQSLYCQTFVQTYTSSMILSTTPFYQIYWNYNTTHCMIGTRAQISGWFALGLNMNDIILMYPSDVWVMWITPTGQGNVVDAYTSRTRNYFGYIKIYSF